MKYLKFSCLSLTTIFAICLLFPQPVKAQEKIGNEARFTLVPTFAVNKKVFLTTYAGYVYSGGTQTHTFYLGAPFLCSYRPHKVVELMIGALLIGNFGKNISDNMELRPLAGLKVIIPNQHNLHLFNWTRYEMRNTFYVEENSPSNTIKHRLRNRLGIEFPITKHAWEPKSLYGLADIEVFYTVPKNYLDLYRVRFGLGYCIDKEWKMEFIYHIQIKQSSAETRPEWTDNIFRLNFKWTIPHKKYGTIDNPTDLDD